MLFSEKFIITKSKEDDRFDPFLSMDTKLFIDPFLVIDSKHIFFEDFRSKIADYFQCIFELAAISWRNNKDERHKMLIKNLKFPEAKEICLWYSNSGVEGAGSAWGFAKQMLSSIYLSIDEGLQYKDFFDRVWILNKWIWPDRISDMTFSLLKKNFIEYTKEICKRHNIPTKSYKIDQCIYDYNNKNRWLTERHDLPENPYNQNAVILVPRHFLRQLSIVNTEAFGNYIYEVHTADLRTQFNVDIKSKLNKSKIIEIAKQKMQWVVWFIKWVMLNKKDSYDFNNDPAWLINWYGLTKDYVKLNPLNIESFDWDGFSKFINKIVQKFKIYIEDNGWNSLLWDSTTKFQKHKSEHATQLAFLGIIKWYCEMYNVNIGKETDVWRWPVDFVFSQGSKMKLLLEIKHIENSKLWAWLEKQLLQYMKSEECNSGYFLIVWFKDEDFKKIKDINARVEKLIEKTGYELFYEVIDARSKPSASKL